MTTITAWTVLCDAMRRITAPIAPLTIVSTPPTATIHLPDGDHLTITATSRGRIHIHGCGQQTTWWTLDEAAHCLASIIEDTHGM